MIIMNRKLLTFVIGLTIIAGAFLPVFSNTAHAQIQILDNTFLRFLNPVTWFEGAFSFLAAFLLRIGASILILAGILFDYILDFTVVNMAANINDPQGIGGGINVAWKTIRDVGNMVFIFILLYAAVKLILGLGDEMGKTIKNIIIVGLLINFSLFFTKVVIDASNIAAIGFYNSIVTAGQSQSVTLIPGSSASIQGFTAIFMRAVGIQSFFGPDILTYISAGSSGNFQGIMIMAIMGTIAMIVLAIVFLVASVMFITRYILLIFILILSPLAIIGYAVPGLKGKYNEWWDALIAQSFFAPFFMLLIWVAMKLVSTPNFLDPGLLVDRQWSTIATDPKGAIGLILNYVLVIGFIVAALIMSKKMAGTKAFKDISGGVSKISFGSVAALGRQTVGRFANARANNTDLRDRAARGDVGARMQLATARKLSTSTFDVRGIQDSKLAKATSAGELLGTLGKTGNKGGFNKYVEERATAQAKYAKEAFGQTLSEKAALEKFKEEEKYDEKEKQENAKVKNIKDDIKNRMKLLRKNKSSTTNEDEIARINAQLLSLDSELNKKDSEFYSKEFKELKAEYDKYNDTAKNRQVAYAERIEKGPSNIKTVSIGAALAGPVGLGIGATLAATGLPKKISRNLQENKAASAKVREQAKAPSKEKRLADLANEIEKEKKAKEEAEKEENESEPEKTEKKA